MQRYLKSFILVWIFFSSQIVQANTNQWSFIGLENKSVFSLVSYKGFLHAGTEEGVWLYDSGKKQWDKIGTGDLTITTKKVTTLLVVKDKLYAGTDSAGVYGYDLVSGDWSKIPGPSIYSTASITALAKTVESEKHGIFYVGTAIDGVFQFDSKAENMVAMSNSLTNKSIRALVGGSTTLYAGTSDAGVFQWVNNQWAAYSNGLDALNTSALSFFNGTLYVGTEDGRTYFADKTGTWSLINEALFDKKINALIPFNVDLYMGTQGEGVFRYNGKNWFNTFNKGTDINTGLSKLNIQSLTVHENGLYAGTDSGGFQIQLDEDLDGVFEPGDNCPATANPDQENNDKDKTGDMCDKDDDNDSVLDSADNCPLIANVSQKDIDGDKQGDHCDEDDDGDGVTDAADNCPLVANPGQENSDSLNDGGDACDGDIDSDGVENEKDNCPMHPNPDQTNTDGSSLGDACDEDDDDDGVLDNADNCPTTQNADGKDSDSDGKGDLCDKTPVPFLVEADSDADGHLDTQDNCPKVSNADQKDDDADGIGNACDPDFQVTQATTPPTGGGSGCSLTPQTASPMFMQFLLGGLVVLFVFRSYFSKSHA